MTTTSTYTLGKKVTFLVAAYDKKDYEQEGYALTIHLPEVEHMKFCIHKDVGAYRSYWNISEVTTGKSLGFLSTQTRTETIYHAIQKLENFIKNGKTKQDFIDLVASAQRQAEVV